LTQFSVVVPTLDAAEDIDRLLTRLLALDLAPGSFEVIMVDMGSRDGTPDRVRAWEGRAPVRLVECREKPDLADSILAGVAVARAEVIVVMHADLSHPPERLPALVAPLLDGSHDIAVGSRYVAGGSNEEEPLPRRWLARLGGWLTRSLCDVSDVASGFFAFRRERAGTLAGRAQGHEILLSLLMAGQAIKVMEVPIHYHSRPQGRLSLSPQWTYLQHLMTLAGGTATFGTASRLAAAGLVGVAVDALLFQWLMSRDAGLALSHITSFFLAAAVKHALNSRWSLRPPLRWRHFSRLLTVGLFALLMRGGVLAWLIYGWHLPPLLAIFPAIAATTVISYLGAAFYVFPATQNLPPADVRWRVASLGVVTFVVLLRLIYLGQAELIPDEAYYWAYAQHMDLSFYDHPPMVAWLIWLGTALFGNTEFGVRIGAFACGLITMGYLYTLARNLYDKTTGLRTLLLLAVLPFYFATGMVMTADAPLVAAWAATLYYMERVLLGNSKWAWLGLGIAFGLGILSKYTLGLLGPAALLFVILDPASRRWLYRPHAYLAAALALLLFSPVIIWNMQHDWASITFQSSRVKGVGDDQFAVHELFLHLMVLLTPVGLFAAAIALWPGTKRSYSTDARRRRLFVWAFTGVPLAVFFVLSIFDSQRFHWTGPIWLAVLPTMAWMMGHAGDFGTLIRRVSEAWKPTIAVCLVVYAFALHYVVLGIPGVPYKFLSERYFWREATSEVEQIAAEIRQRTGREPIVIGMSKWSVAAPLSFYNRSNEPMEIRSRNMFGDSGAMYDFWYPSESPTTRPILMVGIWRHDLEHTSKVHDIARMLVQPGPIQERVIMREGKPLRQVHYRIAQGYLGKNP
jgi:dolichol-phosphate mannosyltransferase